MTEYIEIEYGKEISFFIKQNISKITMSRVTNSIYVYTFDTVDTYRLKEGSLESCYKRIVNTMVGGSGIVKITEEERLPPPKGRFIV